MENSKLRMRDDPAIWYTLRPPPALSDLGHLSRRASQVRSDWGSWVILNAPAHLPGPVRASEAVDQMQGHVDASRHASRGDYVAVVDVASAGLQGNVRFHLVKQRQ